MLFDFKYSNIPIHRGVSLSFECNLQSAFLKVKERKIKLKLQTTKLLKWDIKENIYKFEIELAKCQLDENIGKACPRKFIKKIFIRYSPL